MGYKDRTCRRTYRCSQTLWSKVPVFGIDIHQNWTSPDGMDAKEIAHIIVGGHDYFVAWTNLQGSQGQFDGESAAAAGEYVLDLVHASQALFQACNMSTLIATPRAVAICRLHRLENRVVGQGPCRRTLGPDRFATQNCRPGTVSLHVAGPFSPRDNRVADCCVSGQLILQYLSNVVKGATTNIYC